MLDYARQLKQTIENLEKAKDHYDNNVSATGRYAGTTFKRVLDDALTEVNNKAEELTHDAGHMLAAIEHIYQACEIDVELSVLTNLKRFTVEYSEELGEAINILM